MPFLPAVGLVTAITIATSAFLPEVINCLAPFKTYSSPSRTARVRIAPASEPTCGSVKQNAPSHSPLAMRFKNCSFCQSLPKRSIGPHPTELVTEIMVETEPSPAAISSSATAAARVSKPAPPHSVGTVIPNNPNSPNLRKASAGKVWFCAHCAA